MARRPCLLVKNKNASYGKPAHTNRAFVKCEKRKPCVYSTTVFTTKRNLEGKCFPKRISTSLETSTSS